MKLIRKIWSLAAMQWSSALQYRTDLFLWMLADTTTPLISLAVWYAVAKSSPGGPSPRETLTYYVLVIVTFMITNAWGGFFMSTEILNGDVIKHLVKPVSPFWNYILNNAVEKIIKLTIPLPLFLLALWAWPNIFSESLYQPRLWIIGIISLMLATSLSFALDLTFGALAFWLEDAHQLRNYKEMLFMTTSGILIPVIFMPSGVQTIVNLLPFRSIIGTPTEILLGRLSGPDIISAIGIQIAWLTTVIVIIYILWKKGLNRYAPPGQ